MANFVITRKPPTLNSLRVSEKGMEVGYYSSKITSKGQATVPAAIRAALRVMPGDLIVWEILPEGKVHVNSIKPTNFDYLSAVQSTLSEWCSPADEEAYQEL